MEQRSQYPKFSQTTSTRTTSANLKCQPTTGRHRRDDVVARASIFESLRWPGEAKLVSGHDFGGSLSMGAHKSSIPPPWHDLFLHFFWRRSVVRDLCPQVASSIPQFHFGNLREGGWNGCVPSLRPLPLSFPAFLLCSRSVTLWRGGALTYHCGGDKQIRWVYICIYT